MAGPFFFGITTFTLLFLSADVLMRAARMIVDQGHSAAVAGFFVLCNLPRGPGLCVSHVRAAGVPPGLRAPLG